MKGPERVSWLRYYIAQPIISICNALGERISTLWIKMKGGWYCEYCHKVHCRRVYKYQILVMPSLSGNITDVSNSGTLRDIADEPYKYVCSLGRDAITNNTWTLQPTFDDKIQSAFDQVGSIFKV